MPRNDDFDTVSFRSIPGLFDCRGGNFHADCIACMPHRLGHRITNSNKTAFGKLSSEVCDVSGRNCVYILNKLPDDNYERNDMLESGVPVEIVRFLINIASRHKSFYEIGSRNGHVLSEIQKHTNVSVAGMEREQAAVDAAHKDFKITLTLGSFPETQLPDSDVYFFWIYANLIPTWVENFRYNRFPSQSRKWLYVASDWEYNGGQETKALRTAALEHFGAKHYREYKIPFYRGEEYREFGIFVVGEMELTQHMQKNQTPQTDEPN